VCARKYAQLAPRLRSFGKVLWKRARWCIRCLNLWYFCVWEVFRERRCRWLALPEQLASWLRGSPADAFTGLNVSYWETVADPAGHRSWGCLVQTSLRRWGPQPLEMVVLFRLENGVWWLKQSAMNQWCLGEVEECSVLGLAAARSGEGRNSNGN